jgi:predicted lipoprotein with Yx(FWY)xxD motif
MRPFVMALILATAASALGAATASAQTPAPAAAPAQTPNARVFNSGSGLILYTIKADKAADFESVISKTKEALAKSAKPERKQQAATWKVFKAAEAGANGNVTYVMVMDPTIKEADYNVINLLNEVFPTEVQALYKTYTESFASGLIPINLIPVADFSK